MLDRCTQALGNEIYNNEQQYISMAEKSTLKENCKTIKTLYKEFVPLYRKYAVQSVNISMSNLNYAHAQAQRKKDPYIRGGMAQGIAGVGAGIYTAIDTSNRNAKIDQSREYWKSEAKKDNEKEKSMEGKVISLMNQLLKELLTIPEIKEHREKIIESNYIQAKQLQSKVYSFNNIMRAQEKFEVLGNYKDSKQLKLKCND